MRAEFIINKGWRQVENCGCGVPGFTYKKVQAKRLKLSRAHPNDHYLCPDCANELLQTRYLIEAMIQKQMETEAMEREDEAARNIIS